MGEMNRKLDLLLVKPGGQKRVFGEKISESFSAVEPPMWAALIAAFIRDYNFSVDIIDAEVENLDHNETAERIIKSDPNLVIITVTGTNLSASTWNMPGASNLLKTLKNINPDIKTLLWGLHPSSLPERTLKEELTDFVIQGEGFYSIVRLLELLKSGKKANDFKVEGLWYKKNGEIISNGYASLIKNLDELPIPAWELLPIEQYRAHNWMCFDNLDKRKPFTSIYTSLGCPFDCHFCSLKTLFGKTGIRFRSPEKVIEEIDFLVENYNMRNIKILDELFAVNRKHVIKFCDLIIERGYDLNMYCYGAIDTVDAELLTKMKNAGINWICYGIESVSKQVLEGVNKGRYNKNTIKNVIEMTKNVGINVLANLMFGLPDDNFDTMRESLELVQELNCEYSNFYTTMAYPGSRLYEDSLSSGVELPETWLGYAQYSEETFPLSTKYLSGAEVLSFRDWAFEKYHSNPKYLEMIREKFGQRVVDHILKLLKHPIKRKYV